MNIEHLVIIRFSVIFKNRPEFKKLENNLFNKDRLDLRFNLFEKFCLWSIVNQSLKNFKVILIHDKNLPIEYLNKLINLTKDYKYIILHEWNINECIHTNEWLQKYVDKSKELLITSRFDDDDIIRVNLNEEMYDYINRKKKYIKKNNIISFANGKFIYIDNNDDYSISNCCYKKSVGIWLSHIADIKSNINIYSYDHSRIKDIRIFNLKLNFGWGCINHEYGNDNRIIRMKQKYKNSIEKTNLKKIYNLFGYLNYID